MLVCTDHEHQARFGPTSQALMPHAVLRKWLYIDSTHRDFESTMAAVAKRMARKRPALRRRSTKREAGDGSGPDFYKPASMIRPTPSSRSVSSNLRVAERVDQHSPQRPGAAKHDRFRLRLRARNPPACRGEPRGVCGPARQRQHPSLERGRRTARPTISPNSTPMSFFRPRMNEAWPLPHAADRETRQWRAGSVAPAKNWS